MKLLIASVLAALQLLVVEGGNNTSSTSGAYGTNLFAESEATYYDGYQQAWRYLGWYVQCGNPSDRYSNSGSGSHESQQDDDDGGYEANNWCQRYLMWAMYVDPDYEGGGIGEYSFYNYEQGQWDESACNYHGNGRCAPMDCHSQYTETWQLLGVYKEATYFGNDAFFEQLFKHEGVCVWNDEDTYEFMSEAREGGFSEGCLQTTVYNDDNTDLLYIDLKPTFNGNMSYALYTDEICKTEYDGLDVSVETVAMNMGMLYGKYMQQWNDALEIYKVCQPCMAYNLQKTSSSYNSNSNQYGYNKYKKYSSYRNFKNYYNGQGGGNYRYDDDDDIYGENSYNYANDPNEGYFVCEDDADYTNVNQCMKFRTHAELEPATWEDLVMATNQGGILQIDVGGTIFGSERISREEEEYWEQVRRNEVQKEKAKEAAEKAAQELALQQAKREKANASLFMLAGFAALGAAAAYLVLGPKDKESDLAEPFFDKESYYGKFFKNVKAPDFKAPNFKAPDLRNLSAFRMRAQNSEVV